MLTTTASSDPTPLSIGHAGTSVGSLWVVPSVTGVGHCGSKRCTRATSFTIGRNVRGRTTADSCREDTSTAFVVATMQVHEIQCNIKGMHVYTSVIMQAKSHIGI